MDEFFWFFSLGTNDVEELCSFPLVFNQCVARSCTILSNSQLGTALKELESTRTRKEGEKASKRGAQESLFAPGNEAKLARKRVTRASFFFFFFFCSELSHSEKPLTSSSSYLPTFLYSPTLSLALLSSLSLATMVNVDANLIIKVICCIFLPPLGVFLVRKRKEERRKGGRMKKSRLCNAVCLQTPVPR